MDTREYETKVLNIDPSEIAQKLRELGAQEQEEFLLRRYVYDMESESAEWIRLRTNGQKTTVAYKKKHHTSTAIGNTVEIETEIPDFDKMAQILAKIPFKRVLYQEIKAIFFI